MNTKRFKEKDNTAVFTTSFVITDKKDITLITHDADDGAWQSLSDDHFDRFEDVAKIVGLGQMVKIDSSVLEVADLKEGYVAHRRFKGDTWVIEKHQ